MSEETTTERVVYIGRRALESPEKLAHWYRSLDVEDRTVGSMEAYGKQPIGTILEITHPADDRSKTYVSQELGPRAVDAWTNADEINEWRTADRAEAQLAANAKRIRKDLDGIPDEFNDALTTIEKHMAKLNRTQRAALATYVNARILGGQK